MSLPTFKYKVNRIFSHFDETTKKRRIIWVRAFRIFWKLTMYLKETADLLAQMDEKSDFVIITKGNGKNI